MSQRIRRILSAAIVVAAASVTTACVIPLPSQPQQTTPQTQPVQTQPVQTEPVQTEPATETSEPAPAGPSAADEAALASYVEAERAALSNVMLQNPGVYSAITVEGAFEEVAGDAERPDGTYATVTFLYTYSQTTDWAVAGEYLDQQRETIDGLCTTLFPTMEARGVPTPIAVVYAYGDATTNGAAWSHTCWTT